MLGNDTSPVDIMLKEDGVYVVIDNTLSDKKVSRKDVLDAIEMYGVEDLDFMAINEIFKSDEPKITKRISQNMRIKENKEEFTIEVSRDKLEAFVKFIEPTKKATPATIEDVLEKLSAIGIVHGIERVLLPDILENKKYGTPYVVARGTPPVNGTDGYTKYNFDKSAGTAKPKLLEDGSVDFKQLELVKICKENEVLAFLVPPVDGKDGTDVYGNPIAFRKGKPAVPFAAGKNVSLSEDGLTLRASLSGQIIAEGSRISVSPVLEVKENVDNSTGDIDFTGSVIVYGNVLTGFKVISAGNIEIKGVVEGAYIKAGSHVFLGSGVKGGDKAEIIAGGDINGKYIENCNLEAGRNINADSIIHSNVKCGGELMLSGRKGMLVGGKIIVGSKVSARTIGSMMATVTEIEVGHSVDTVEEYRQLTETYNKTSKDYEQIGNIVDTLGAISKKGELTEDRKAYLIKCLHTKNMLAKKLQEIQARLDELLPDLQEQRGEVRAQETIHSGVKVIIGNAMMHVRDDIKSCRLINKDGKIVLGYAD